MRSLVVTVIGKDRPGLVSVLSETVAAFGGNWLESRMAHLAGAFAGILSVSVPEAKAEGLIEALRQLEALGLRLAVEQGAGETSLHSPARLKLELVGHDHPGIVRDITRALAERGVNIEELATEILAGSWSGAQLFRATARLRVPGEVATRDLQEILERLASDLMVDLALDEIPATDAS